MRKHKPVKKQPESVVFDRTPAQHKLSIDLDTAIVNAIDMGLSHAAVVEMLLMQANTICEIAEERGEDLSALEGLLS